LDNMPKGPQGRKRPRDPVQLGKLIGDILITPIPPTASSGELTSQQVFAWAHAVATMERTSRAFARFDVLVRYLLQTIVQKLLLVWISSEANSIASSSMLRR
jgi:hypothetical protein